MNFHLRIDPRPNGHFRYYLIDRGQIVARFDAHGDDPHPGISAKRYRDENYPTATLAAQMEDESDA